MVHPDQCARLFACFILALMCSFSVSGSPAEGTTDISIDELNKQLFQTQQAIRSLQAKVSDQKEKLANVQEQSQPVLEQYFKAKKNIQSLKEQIDRDGSLNLASQFKTEELKFIMVEGRYEEANSAITLEQEQLAKLEKRLSWQQSKATKLSKQKHEAIAIAEQAEINRQQQASKALAAENAAAQAELLQLRALLAEREQALAKAQEHVRQIEQEKAEELFAAKQAAQTAAAAPTQQPAAHVSANPTANTGVEAAVDPLTSGDRSNAANANTETPEQQASNAATPGDNPDVNQTNPSLATAAPSSSDDSTTAAKPAHTDDQFTIISDRQMAQAAIAEFSEKTRLEKRNNSQKIIKVKNLTRKKSFTKIMQAKGKHHFQVRLRLRGGNHEFRVGRTLIKATVPANEELTSYLALLDTQSDNKKLVLIEREALK